MGGQKGVNGLPTKYRIRPQVLDKIRSSRGLGSDEALARDLELTVRTISNIRAGKQPSLATTLRILDAADIELKAAIEVVKTIAA